MLTPWNESYDRPRQHIEKQRHCFANKGQSSWAYGFSSSHVWMWRWTLKKVECWRIHAFEMWCCRTLLRVPWTARRPTILKDISLEYSLETLMLKWKLQYSGHLMQRTDSLEKTLILKKIEGRRRRGRQRVRWMDSITTQWTWVWASSGSWWWTGRPDELQSMGLQRVGHDWVAELNWTELKKRRCAGEFL